MIERKSCWKEEGKGRERGEYSSHSMTKSKPVLSFISNRARLTLRLFRRTRGKMKEKERKKRREEKEESVPNIGHEQVPILRSSAPSSSGCRGKSLDGRRKGREKREKKEEKEEEARVDRLNTRPLI